MARRAEEYLDLAYQGGATDILLTAGAPPTMRVHGDLQAMDQAPLTSEAIADLVKQLLTPERQKQLAALQEVDFAINWHDRCRFRANAYVQRGSDAISLRVIPYEIPKMERLGLPAVVMDLVQ